MWPKDAGNWGLAIGIAAIVLTIPLSMIGNMLTPRFLNWWAERSISSMRKRIAKLEKELGVLEGIPPMTLTEDFLFTSHQFTQNLLIKLTPILLLVLLILIKLGPGQALPNTKRFIWVYVGPILAMGIAILGSYFINRRFIGRYHRLRSPQHRALLKYTIAELKDKLKSRDTSPER